MAGTNSRSDLFNAGVALVLVICTPGIIASQATADAAPTVMSQANLVLVGDIASGRQDGALVTLNLEVVRVLSGDVEAGRLLTALWEWPKGWRPMVESGQLSLSLKDTKNVRGLWFIRKETDGQLRILTSHPKAVFQHTHVPVPKEPMRPEFVYPTNAALAEKVALELGSAIEHAYAGSVARDSPWRSVFFRAMPFVQSLRVVEMWRRFSVSANRELRLIGLSELIRRDDPAALQTIADELEDFARSPEFWSVSSAIGCCFRNASPQGISALGRIAASASSPTNLKAESAFVLRAVHTREALPFLARLLDSPDANIRYQAMAGLASFANSSHVPLDEKLRARGQYVPKSRGPHTTNETIANFPPGPVNSPEWSARETKYLSFWRSWWARMESEVTR
jgi:hypothetical protein